MLCPVPLGAQRLRERGYNQSHEIAKKLSALCNIKYTADLMVRTRETMQQSTLNIEERKQNLRNAFTLSTPNLGTEIKGKHIAVCDDVITSGTTLNEIARLLKQNGALLVSNYVFARTPHH